MQKMGIKLALSFTLGLLLGSLSVLVILDGGGGGDDCSEMRRRMAKQGCSCEEMAKEIEYLRVRLRFLEKANSSSSSSSSSSRRLFLHAPPTRREDRAASLKEFMFPHNRNNASGSPIFNNNNSSGKEKERLRKTSHYSKLKDEYLQKKTVFVGVLTQQAYLPTRAKTLYETWGKEIDGLAFFVGEDCIVPPELLHLPIIKLNGIRDNVYPPLNKTFAVLQYMFENYINEYSWFVRADDDVYVRTKKLKDLLSKMLPYEEVYMGRAGTGRKEDLQRLNLLPHEIYCMGGPGIIMSMALLRQLGPHLDDCLNAGTRVGDALF